MSKRNYILLEPNPSRLVTFKPLNAWVCRTPKDIGDVGPKAPRSAVWIAFSARSNDHFLKAIVEQVMPPRGRLLALKPPDKSDLPILTACFERVFGVGDFRFLPDEELVEVLKEDAEIAKDSFIGGAYDAKWKALGLIRGDMTMLVVPLSIFLPNRTTRPDPSRLSFTDYGGTVCLGPYEASADSILYEVDPKYRSEIQARRRATAKTFGASLRRARQHFMLSRRDFAPLSEKEIARIERSEIKKPHADTLGVICKKLGMTEDEIKSW